MCWNIGVRNINRKVINVGGMIMAEEYVKLVGVNKYFGDFKASDNIDISIEKGKLIGLLGPSGSGKTTILKMLAGLEDADSGDIYIGGEKVNQVKPSERGIGFVFQNYALFRYKTVYENIAFGLKIAKWNKADIKNRVMELIELVGLRGFEKRYPSQLSGGQRQRVAFARAIATEPKLLLLDEPFAAVDAKVRKELRAWLRELITKVGITSIFVTHDQDEATEVADEIIIMNRGRVEQIGSPVEIYNNPKTPFVAEFLGENVKVSHVEDMRGFEGIAHAALIRPEYVVISKKNELVRYPASTEEGEVIKSVFRGSLIEVTVRLHGQELIGYRQVSQPLLHDGENVNIFIQKMNIIDENTAYVVENETITAAESLVI